MKFYEQLNAYLQALSVSQKELAQHSGLSTATVSRLCSGKREPAYNSKELEDLAGALVSFAKEQGVSFPEYGEIYQTLRESVEDMLHVDYEVFLENLNYLLKYLGVKNTELANGIHSDLSHISRILSGNSNPGNPNVFIHDVATYLALRYTGSNEVGSLAKLLDARVEEVSTSASLRDRIVQYLGSHVHIEVDDSIPHFLRSLDAFNLQDYLKAVHFDDIKIPSSVPHLPTRKEYTGIRKMMESEIDFMKTTVLSKSNEDCILYSDMPLEEMAADPEFPKKYMLGMAMMLKKGLHIHMIHDVNRPFPEMMLGLESWIPLYMTGQISPYYLPASQSQVFLHFLKVSGSAALEGTAIAGNQASGKYVLYRSREDVKQTRVRAAQLLKKASPLMDIYQKDNKELFRAKEKELYAGSDCKMICSNIPVYFLTEARLQTILTQTEISEESSRYIWTYYHSSRSALLSLLENNKVHLVVPDIRKDQFEEYASGLSLADLFLEEEILLSYEEYTACIEELKALASQHPNLILECNPQPVFHNINISIIGDKMVIVSKEKAPTIHFVIHHKKMVRAFQNFIPPLIDE